MTATSFARLIVGFDALVGYEIDSLDETEVRAHVVVRPELKQGVGLVHGGVYASIAESIASLGTTVGVIGEGNLATGQSNQASFLRPITDGTIHVVARRRHRGRTSWIWDVDFADDDGRLCATVRMTIAVRPIPPGVVVPEALQPR